MADEVIARLTLDREELSIALRAMLRFQKGRPHGEVVFSFEDGDLRLDCAGVTSRAPAVGEWPGRARVAWQDLKGPAEILPGGDPITLTVGEGGLSIQRFRMPAQWSPQTTIAGQLPLILLPLNSTPLELLTLRYRFAEADLAQSGHLPMLEAAERKLEMEMRAAWSKLAYAGVSLTEVRRLTEAAIRRETAKNASDNHS